MICLPPIDSKHRAHKRQARGFTSQIMHKAQKMSGIVFTFATGISQRRLYCYASNTLERRDILLPIKFITVVTPGPVVQSSISDDPGLNINTLFWFMSFYIAVCFKTFDRKTSVYPGENSGKTYTQLYEQAVGKFDLKIWFNPGLSYNRLLNNRPCCQ